MVIARYVKKKLKEEYKNKERVREGKKIITCRKTSLEERNYIKKEKIKKKTHTFNIKFTINTPSSKKRFCIYNKNARGR